MKKVTFTIGLLSVCLLLILLFSKCGQKSGQTKDSTSFYLQNEFESSMILEDSSSGKKILYFENKGNVKNKKPYAAYYANEVLIKLNEGKHIEEILPFINRTASEKGLKIKIVDSIAHRNIFLIRTEGKNLSPFNELEALLEEPSFIEYLEPNYLCKNQSNQSLISYDKAQWSLNNDGEINNPFGKYDADVDGIEAISHYIYGHDPKNEVIVSIIDGGIDEYHPALSAALWDNLKEIPNNNIDDDKNGYIDDVHGWNFASNNRYLNDKKGHGTHVSGIVAGRPNSYRSFTGIAPNSKILVAKTTEDSTSSMFAISKALYYSIENGADIINMSLGSYTYSQTLNDAVNAALNEDIVVVAAAGNDQIDIGQIPVYPGSIQKVICVASTNKHDLFSLFSNYQSSQTGQIQAVRIAAPGEEILSTIPGGYGLKSGTSMAAPHVTGAVALIKGLFPSLSALEIYRKLRNGSDILKSLELKVVEGKRLNIYRSLIHPEESFDSNGISYSNQVYNGQQRWARYPFANSGEPRIDGKSLKTAYKICSMKQLMNIGDNPEFADKYYILTNNIDWNELLTFQRQTISQTFTGKIYGEGFSIKNFKMRTALNYVGLFRSIGYGGAINNLKFTGVDVSGVMRVGVVAAEVKNGILNNVQVEGNVEGEFYYTGGLVGESSATIFSNCFFEGTISSKSNFSGGISGRLINNSQILKSQVKALINSHANAGGITGYLQDSYIGYSNSFVNIKNTNGSWSVGGLVGDAEKSQIENSYSEGYIDAISNSGGLIGYAKQTRIKNCYSTVYVSQSENSGGLVGNGKDLTFISSYYHHASKPGAGGIGKSISDLKKRETYVGWWNDYTWLLVENFTPALIDIPRINLNKDIKQNGIKIKRPKS